MGTEEGQTRRSAIFPEKDILFDRAALVSYLGREKELEDFKKDLDLVRKGLPEISNWLQQKPMRIVEHAGDWENIIKLASWWKQNPKSSLFAREIPAVEDTKFVEKKISVLREILTGA